MIGRLLKYEDFYEGPKPEEKFQLIKNIPRGELIAVISSVNYLIKAPLDLDFDHSFENQIRMIESIFLVPQNQENRKYSKQFCARLIQIHREVGGGVSVFTRVSCLYALNEVLSSDKLLYEKLDEFSYTLEDTQNIFKLLLLCNGELLSYNKSYSEITSDKLRENFFEAFMFKEIPHNQYYYIQNPWNLLQRSFELFQFIKNRYERELTEFLRGYELSSPEDYLGIISQFTFSKTSNPPLHVFKVPKSDLITVKRLDNLSIRGRGKPNSGIKKFEFLEIKKSPFYKIEGAENNIYFLMDSIFLIEKSYDLFFWDFYFDQLRPKGLKIEDWGNEVGQFFENYSDRLLRNAFEGHKDIKYRATDELKVRGSEFADFYIRRKRQIVLIQAKRSFVPQLNYKEVNSLTDFNNLDKEEFYRRFGLYQMVESTIEPFFDFAPEIDEAFPRNKVFVYPVLLINEPIISMPVTQFIFNRKFEQILQKKKISRNSSKIKIDRLTILHINELEKLEQSIKDKNVRLDRLLQQYSHKRELNSSDRYAPFTTMDNFLKSKIKGKAIPKRTLSKDSGVYKQLIKFLNLS